MYDNIDDDRIKALAQFLGLDDEEAEEIENHYGNYYEYGDAEYFVGDDDEAQEEAIQREIDLSDDIGLESFNEDYQDYIIDNFCNWDWESAINEWNENYAYDISHESDDEYGLRIIQEVVTDDSSFFDDTEGGMIVKVTVKGKDYYLDNDGKPVDDKDEASIFLSKESAEKLVDEDIIREELDIDDDTDIYYEVEFDESLIDIDAFQDALVEILNGRYKSISDVLKNGWIDKDSLKDYIDWEAVAEDVLNNDGRASILAGYDGKENEEEIDGETYYIYRCN